MKDEKGVDPSGLTLILLSQALLETVKII